jgi:hypothetical protein
VPRRATGVWVSDVERSDDSNQAVPWRPPLSLILVSVLAVGAAVVHVAVPSLTIDAVTLGLLAVAALPWLAPVVKSFKFGSLEVDLRDLQQNLYEGRSRVEESVQKVDDLSDQVQRIAFAGAVDAGTRTELETVMSGFFAHLRQAGLPLPSTEPHVEVVDRGRVTRSTSPAAIAGAPRSPRRATSSTSGRPPATTSGATSRRASGRPTWTATASFASTLVELTEQQRGAMAATQVQEVFRKRASCWGDRSYAGLGEESVRP